ncbi:MAG: agmatinase [Deltaproteobacteria bacterium]|nr:agmatinase [Deltaproteobacteria bacterium]
MAERLFPFGPEEIEHCNYEDCRVAILPIPYEGTVSYGGGTSKGPAALLKASANLEYYDEELDQDTCDIGIHTLPPVDIAATPAAMMENIREAALKPVKDGKFLCAIGGEHSVTKGILDALIEQRGKDFGVLQLDAHADLRDKYDGSPHSHACIMRRVHDMGLPYAQAGIRSMSREDADFVKKNKRKIFFARDMQGDASWMDEILVGLPERIFITIDIDCLDPSIMPSTGTPEPGGLDWHTTTAFLKKVAQEKEVIGFDLVELAPIEGINAPDFLAAKLVYRLLGYIFKV